MLALCLIDWVFFHCYTVAWPVDQFWPYFRQKAYSGGILKPKFGELLNSRNHILIWKQNYIKNWFPYALWTTHSLSSTKTLKYICVRQPLLYYYCLWNRKFVIIYIILVSNQNMVPEIKKFATFVFHPSITIFDVIPTKFFLQMKEEVKLF